MSTFSKDKSGISVSAVVCCAANGVIGLDNKIPWQGRVSGEQILFKLHTLGKAVIMGRKTWESLPKKYRPLPLRLNIVLSSKQNCTYQDAIETTSLEQALHTVDATPHYTEAVLIGGQRVYEEGLKYCDTVYLTTLEAIFPGDTYFPKLNMRAWTIEKEQYYPVTSNREVSYTFQVLRRRK